MNKFEYTLLELLNMLKNIEPNIKVRSGQVLHIDSSDGTKRKSKEGFGKAFKMAMVIKEKKDNTKSDDPCNHCGIKDYWKMSYKAYLASLK